MNLSKLISLAVLVPLAAVTAATQEKYGSSPLVESEFASMGGGGIVIKDCKPVVGATNA